MLIAPLKRTSTVEVYLKTPSTVTGTWGESRELTLTVDQVSNNGEERMKGREIKETRSIMYQYKV